MAGVVVLAGCTSGGGADGYESPPRSQASESAPAGPQTPLVPAKVPTETVDQFGKLKLTLHRPERRSDNDGELAIRAWVTYTRAYYNALATYVVDPELAKVATDDEFKQLRDYFADRKASQDRVGGELEITVRPRYSEDGTSLSGCMDQSGLRIVHANETLHPDPEVVKKPEVDLLPDLTRESGEWRVESFGDGGMSRISNFCAGGEWPH
ncbi:hypothetical protein ACFCV3_01960 [Kribbella sp. NPDC056345]|uniref:hypothetical protein n=1 Tax=Kribbella sp. NPDC056345 TaxID=3345789 RepID=UPI0035DADD10